MLKFERDYFMNQKILGLVFIYMSVLFLSNIIYADDRGNSDQYTFTQVLSTNYLTVKVGVKNPGLTFSTGSDGFINVYIRDSQYKWRVSQERYWKWYLVRYYGDNNPDDPWYEDAQPNYIDGYTNTTTKDYFFTHYTDQFGNTGIGDDYWFRVIQDITPPAIPSFDINQGSYQSKNGSTYYSKNNASLNFSWNCSDDSAGVYGIDLAFTNLNTNQVTTLNVFSATTLSAHPSSYSVTPGKLASGEYSCTLHVVDGVGNENYSSPIKITVAGDDSAPSAPTVFSPNPPVYTAGSVIVTASGSTCPTSYSVPIDHYQHSSDHSTWVDGDSVTVNSNNTIVYFRAVNVMGIVGAVGQYTVTNIDTQPPPQVSLSYTETSSGNTLSWTGVADNPSGSCSGVDHYNVYINTKSNLVATIAATTDNIGHSYSLNLLLSHSTNYSITVDTVDKVGETSSSTLSPPLTTPSCIGIASITSNATRNVNGVPVYSNTINFSGDKNGVDHYILKSVNSLTQGIETKTLTNSDLQNNTYTDIRTGAVYAHQKLDYTIISVYTAGFWNDNGIRNTVQTSLLNYPANYTLSVTKNDTAVADVSSSTSAYTILTNTLSGWAVLLGNGTDIEGDPLSLTLRGNGTPYSIGSTFLNLTSVTLLSPNTTMVLTPAVTEVQKGTSTLLDTYYAGPVTVKYDTIPPVIADGATLTSTDGTVMYDTSQYPTKSKYVNVHLRVLNTGTVDTGVAKSRIANAEQAPTSAADYTEYPVTNYDYGTFINQAWTLSEPDGNKTVWVQVVDGAGNASSWSSLSTLLDRVPPNVGTGSSSVLKVLNRRADRILVGLPSNDLDGNTTSYAVTVDGVTVAIQRVQNADGTTSDIDGNGYYEYSIPVSSRGANTLIALTFVAKDLAGNTVTVPVTNFYTDARVPSDRTSQGLDGNKKQFITYLLGTDGAASRYSLELLTPKADQSGSVQYVIDSAHDLSPTQPYTASAVRPHAVYYYQVAAYNVVGDRSVGSVETVRVQDYAPSIPVLISPTRFSKDVSPTFSWDSSTDVDGDSLSYTMKYRVKGSTSWISLAAGGETNITIPDTLEDAGVYEWYVEVLDSWNTDAGTESGAAISSAIGSFIEDLTPPTVHVPKTITNGSDFTNAKTMAVSANDANGIATISYWYEWTDGTGQTIDTSKTPISIETGADGSVSGIVGLQESPKDVKGNGIAYYVHVVTTDEANNPTETVTGPIRVDWTKPDSPSATPILPSKNVSYVSTSAAFSVTVTAHDDYAGIKNLRYWLTEMPDTLSGSGSVSALQSVDSPLGDASTRTLTVPVNLSGKDGRTYYLVAAIEDWAGNISDPVTVQTPILYDSTAPVASLSVQGLTASGGTYYLNDSTKLSTVYSCEDPDTGATAEFALVPQGSGTASSTWRGSATELRNDLVAGQTYTISLRGTNGVGGQTLVSSFPFMFDPTAPVNLAVSATGVSSLVSGERVHVTGSASDPESGIANLQLSIGSAPGGTDISMNIAGNVSGYISEAGRVTGRFDFSLPEVPDGTYYLTLVATNGAGLVNRLNATNVKLVINNQQEKLVVADQGPYTSMGDRLTGSWLYHGKKTVSGYRYRIVGTRGSLFNWVRTTETSVTVKNLSLKQGMKYQFQVQAIFSNGSTSRSSSSSGITLDETTPVFAVQGSLVTPDLCTSTGLSIGWKVSDPESGIARIEAVLETYTYDSDGNLTLTRLTDTPVPLPALETASGIVLSSDATGKALAFTTGMKVAVTLRVTNGAGGTVDKMAPIVIIDNTPPPVPVVIDQGNAINTKTYLAAQWIWTKSDAESGTTGYQWAIMQSKEDVGSAVWHDAKMATAVNLKNVTDVDESAVMVDRSVWYFAVKAKNGAGLESIGYSDGITYDATAPDVATVKLIAGSDTSQNDIQYITSTDGLSVYIDAAEDVSQIMTYRVYPGTFMNGSWTPLSGIAEIVSQPNTPMVSIPSAVIQPGVITAFRGLCINEAGLISAFGYTQGVVMDSTPPTVSHVNGRITGGTLLFDWDSSEGITPITNYYAALLPVEQMSDGPSSADWKDQVLNRSITFTNIAIGQYVLFVKARNAAGLESTAVRSGILTYDTTPPELDGITPSAYYASTHVPVTVTATDPESGVKEYEISVGTVLDPGVYSGGWLDAPYNGGRYYTNLVFSKFPSTIPDGVMIYVSARVRNGSGLWSDVELSKGIKIDKTVPSLPVVKCGLYTTFKTKIPSIEYSSKDLESGIIAIRMAAIKESDLSAGNVMMPTDAQVFPVGNGTSLIDTVHDVGVTLANLSLEEAGRYLIATQMQNGAGDWSGIGYSTAVIVDTMPPQIAFESASKVVNYAPTDIHFSVSEACSVQLSIVDSNGGTQTLATFNADVGDSRFTFPNPAEGLYTVYAKLVDKAGNIGNSDTDAKTFRLRVNAAPRVYIAPFYTTPGQPLSLSVVAFDPDGDTPLSYSWTFGDTGGASTDQTPVHAFYQKDGTTQESVYAVSVRVTDSLGKPSAVATAKVTVDNTTSGPLYTNEYWSGTHHIYGDVTVPLNLTLMVAPSSIVDVSTGAALIVAGTVNTQSSTVFLLDTYSYGTWSGIDVTGTGSFTGVTISNADRGIVAQAGSTVTVTGSALIHDGIGIHAYGSAPVITNTRFQSNERYGIKEDSGAAPKVTGCSFSGNLFDYYNTTATVMSAADINTINGNSGNVNN
jgi:hypothetical protein